MEDQSILDLYFQRSEQAIAETDRKYGGYCYSVAYNILSNREDSEESVSDAYLQAWNTIPPRRPNLFRAFLAKLTRHISIDRWRKRSSIKRGGGEIPLALDELLDCVSQSKSIEDALQRKQAAAALNRFLDGLPETERNVLLCRYWYLDSIASIAEKNGFTPGKVATMLCRTRKKLRICLEKEELL